MKKIIETEKLRHLYYEFRDAISILNNENLEMLLSNYYSKLLDLLEDMDEDSNNEK